ncbi:alpha/beta hydrolase [Kribbella antibiotica]|uniref:Alpha/beta hydrolase n=1 Tax=Kribbella antibiotica TaxID=190195 RepID=A0A4R4ZVJ3_9ACTN|nr:alpha/beta hydrolase [Kribbella antibiotica]TDD63193.1 alpha/beta hydrolase [Kribbella antibiotica]
MSVKSTITRALTAGAALAVTAATLLIPSSSATATQESIAKGPKPTIVLVHGAFADASSWNGEIAELERRGYPVIAPSNPLRSVASDAASVRSVIRSIKGPVVLVGHSYGGQVLTNAAYNEPNVKALVYIAAFIPAKGESAFDLSNKFPGSTLGPTLQPVPLVDGGVDLYVKQDLFWKQFAADVPRAQAKLMAATQRPITEAALKEASGNPAWTKIPSWSLIPTGDKNIPAEAQRFMSKRAHAHTVEVKGASHAVLVSQPHKVTQLIIAAANGS